jgi:hypothetical protein
VLLERGAEFTGIEWAIPIEQLSRVLITFTDGLTLAWLADRDDAAASVLMDFAADTLGALAVPALANPAQPKAN